MLLLRDPVFLDHATPEGHPECPARAEVVAAALEGAPGVHAVRSARAGDEADLVRVHDPGYVASLRGPTGPRGRALDPDTFLSPRSFEVALAATGTVCAGLDAVLSPGAAGGADAGAGADADRRAFAVVRPPGHHARPDRAMGFCLFNHVAVAAARARAVHGVERVAVLDFDVHHGNGTQEAFWRDGSVFFTSLHRDRFYPGSGHADETGEGPGRGTTLNLPLPGATKPAAYLEALARACEAVVAFRPGVLLVSAGFDAYRRDPVGGLGLSAEHYAAIGAALRQAADASAGGRLLAVLEGGYALEALGGLVRAFVAGVEGLAPG